MNSPTTECITDRTTEPRHFSAGFFLKKGRKVVSWLLISTLSSSCCTTALWDATHPNETIEVHPDEVTEAALIEDGFTFHQDEKSGYFHIEKTPSEKAGDYALRVVGTPAAVCTDVLLAGAITMGIAYGSMYGVVIDPAQFEQSHSRL